MTGLADQISTFSAALLVPRNDRFETPKGFAAAGVFDADDAPIPNSDIANFFWRGMAPEGFAETSRDRARPLAGRWLFGGLCRPHFGHLITNSIGRLAAIDHCGPIDGIVFIGDKATDDAYPLLGQLLAALGIDLPHHICRTPTEVETLIMSPDLVSEARDCRVDPAYAAWIRTRIAPAAPDDRRKIYVTRSQMPPDAGRVLSEDVIEDNFVRAGFDIIVPEKLPIAEQVEIYRRAETVVTTDNSALHLIALAAPPDAQVVVIHRRPELPEHLRNHMDGFFGERIRYIDVINTVWFRDDGSRRRMPNAMAELDYADLGRRLTDIGAFPSILTWRAPTLAELQGSRALGCSSETQFAQSSIRGITCLKEQEFEHGANPMTTTQTAIPAIDGIRYFRMLNRLHGAIKPDWYLEVGTNSGKSLRIADCNFVSVDPKFILETPLNHPAAKEMFLFQKTSDDFFASGFCDRNDIRFDFAFLDGLHHYEVLLRDFINAEKLMNADGTILLHDCCPSTVEMTAREQCRGDWTGDVWKTLLILLAHRPDLDIMVSTARPTGLVVIRNLDPKNTVLEQSYDQIVGEWDPKTFDDIPGGLAGYYDNFDLHTPEEVIATFTG